MFEIEKELDGTSCTLKLIGRLDAKTSKEAMDVFEEAAAEAKDIALDMAELEYIASAGLRAVKFLSGKTKKSGGSLVVKNVQEDVMDVFEITGFSAMLVFEQQLAESERRAMKNLTVELNEDSIYEVTDFVMQEVDKYECPPKKAYQIEVVIEEIVTNVVSYSGLSGTGTLSVDLDILNTEESSIQLKLVFSDAGKPFDPLAKEDPDISAEARSEKIGGLGIYMVKQMVDKVSYEYLEGQNTLTVYKSLS